MSSTLTVIFTVLELIAKYGPNVVSAIAEQWKSEGKDVTLEDIEALTTSDDMELIKKILADKAHLLANPTIQTNE